VPRNLDPLLLRAGAYPTQPPAEDLQRRHVPQPSDNGAGLNLADPCLVLEDEGVDNELGPAESSLQQWVGKLLAITLRAVILRVVTVLAISPESQGTTRLRRGGSGAGIRAPVSDGSSRCRRASEWLVVTLCTTVPER
jgi:hypothetical protein